MCRHPLESARARHDCPFERPPRKGGHAVRVDAYVKVPEEGVKVDVLEGHVGNVLEVTIRQAKRAQPKEVTPRDAFVQRCSELKGAVLQQGCDGVLGTARAKESLQGKLVRARARAIEVENA